jgi:hypothetical protein
VIRIFLLNETKHFRGNFSPEGEIVFSFERKLISKMKVQEGMKEENDARRDLFLGSTHLRGLQKLVEKNVIKLEFIC